jgi:hypothetical protein
MSENLSGKPIKCITFPPTNNNFECVRSSELFGLIYSGDEGGAWVTRISLKDGRETNRFNVNYIESIEWM